MPRRWTPARLTAYLRCPVRRLERLHIYGVGGLGATESIVNMQSFCFAAERGLEGSKTELFPLPGGSLCARQGPKRSFANRRGPPRWPPARLTAYLQCPVATSMKAETLSKKASKLRTFLKKAVCKIKMDRRLESLHFKGRS